MKKVVLLLLLLISTYCFRLISAQRVSSLFPIISYLIPLYPVYLYRSKIKKKKGKMILNNHKEIQIQRTNPKYSVEY